jgi:anti-sigma B factor antagonist
MRRILAPIPAASRAELQERTSGAVGRPIGVRHPQSNCLSPRTVVEVSNTTQDGSLIICSITGRIDTASAPALEQAINAGIANGCRKMLLNFSGVSYIGSGGLRVLLAAAKRLKGGGGQFGLCCLSPEVLKILRLAGFTAIFPIHSSEGEALAGW